MASNIYEVNRIKQAHAQAILEVEHQVKHWEVVKQDYLNLSNLLTSLPDKRTHQIMVPFGSFAFMPGEVIHSNELTVHLGDSYFADVTCKQGQRIIDHRLETVNKNLEDLDKTLKNIEKKREFVDELSNRAGEKAYEIKEDVPHDYVHPSQRKRISRVQTQTNGKVKNASSNNRQKAESTNQNRLNQPEETDDAVARASCFSDDELLKRLDELEKLEEEEDQLLLASDINDPPEVVKSYEPDSSPSSNPQFDKKKRVSWPSKMVMEGKDADSDDSDDNDPVIIKFKHSTHAEHHTTNSCKMAGDNASIITPGDIGGVKVLYNSAPVLNKNCDGDAKSLNESNVKKSQPKSILKKSAKVVEKDETNSHPEAGATSPHIRNSSNAINDVVIEHGDAMPQSQVKNNTKKTVSKFKASRRR